MNLRQRERLKRAMQFKQEWRHENRGPSLMDLALCIILITALVIGFLCPSPLFS